VELRTAWFSFWGQAVTRFKAASFAVAELEAQRAKGGKLYREFLRVPTMSAGLYVLPAGATDPQRPHREDEMYYVIRGRARFQAGDEDRGISAGSVLFVGAEVEHRFHDIAEELAVLVFFAPAES
jgi:quercetin dioxygenase-like cupin family protein